MRKVLVVLVAVPLVIGPAAVAHAEGSGDGSGCQVPKLDTHYDVEQIQVDVSLPASGCAAREHRMFDLDTNVTRMDSNGSRDATGRSTTCGPFRSADDAQPGYPPAQYSCNLSVGIDHPKIEAVQYGIDITYPGDGGERTTNMVLSCRSDGNNAGCEVTTPAAEHDAS